MSAPPATLPRWAEWRGDPDHPYTVGVEEEVMLLEPHGWSLTHPVDTLLASLAPDLRAHVSAETHGSALELATGVHDRVAGAAAELRELRTLLAEALDRWGLRVASAGTHAFATWHNTVVSGGERYQLVYGSMRELARREPTFALHVHVGITHPEDAIRAANRLRAYLPLLLALSADSPFWQGRDTGLASARTPLFQAFPRVGIPRRFNSYGDYVAAVDLLIACEAFPEPTFLWWDVRPQPRFGTVEVRIMDAQIGVDDSAALAALVQCLARQEVEAGHPEDDFIDSPELLEENRFLAARDGSRARLIDQQERTRAPLEEHAEAVLVACAPHAAELGCEAELGGVRRLAAFGGADRQRELAAGPDRLPGLVRGLADLFLA
jgi:glutamate---cysteine ligase / carboxylate-amine ligase